MYAYKHLHRRFAFVSCLTWIFSFVFRIGRPPKYRKNQQRDYQSRSFKSTTCILLLVYFIFYLLLDLLAAFFFFIRCFVCSRQERKQGNDIDDWDSAPKGNFYLWYAPKLLSFVGFVCFSSDMSSEGVYPSLFMSALSGQSDRTLSLCWEQHCKLLPGVQGIHASQVAAWSVEEVIKCWSSPSYFFIHLISSVFWLFGIWCVFAAGLQVCPELDWLWRPGSSLQRRGETIK